jgi:hypothetical protein
MADDEKPAKPAAPARIEAPMIFVRGGTTTGAHDAMMARQRADTDQRRATQDAQFEATRRDPLGARMHSMKMGGTQTSPSIVLAVKHPKDNIFVEWITCELSQQGPDDLLLVIACPRCHAERPDHEPGISILQSNRKWWLDTNPPKWMRLMGAERVWVNPNDGSTIVVAGSVTTADWMRCPGLGCPLSFKIDDSVIYFK